MIILPFLEESNRIELKEKLTDSLEKEVVAFLTHKDGGVIYIGINSKKEIVEQLCPPAFQAHEHLTERSFCRQ